MLNAILFVLVVTIIIIAVGSLPLVIGTLHDAYKNRDRWIDVEKALPPEETDVWVWVRTDQGSIRSVGIDYIIDGDWHRYGEAVSKWQPITSILDKPKRPKLKKQLW